MDIATYFPDAIEFEKLLHELFPASDKKRLPEEDKQLVQRLVSSRYFQEVRENQSMNEWNGVIPVLSSATINKLKRDFFFNVSICSSYKNPESYSENYMFYHRHNYLEMIYVAEGSYTQTINGTSYTHNKGDFCLMNPNVLHRDGVSGPNDRAVFICLGQNYVNKELAQVFEPHEELKHFLEYRIGGSSVQYIVFFPENKEDTEKVLEAMLKENREKQPGHHTVIKGLLVRLFYLLVANAEFKECRQTKTEIENNLIGEITQYMENHLTDGNRASVAEQFHFNPDYLNRMLVHALGKTYSEYMRELRMKEAARRLEQTEDSVNCIIRELGFSNKGYFNRIFKESYGVLPGEYRKQI